MECCTSRTCGSYRKRSAAAACRFYRGSRSWQTWISPRSDVRRMEASGYGSRGTDNRSTWTSVHPSSPDITARMPSFESWIRETPLGHFPSSDFLTELENDSRGCCDDPAEYFL